SRLVLRMAGQSRSGVCVASRRWPHQHPAMRRHLRPLSTHPCPWFLSHRHFHPSHRSARPSHVRRVFRTPAAMDGVAISDRLSHFSVPRIWQIAVANGTIHLWYCASAWDVVPCVAVKTMSLKLPKLLLERVEAEARGRRLTKSAVIRNCVEQVLLRPNGRR